MYGKKVSLNFINNIHKIILGELKPNLTFVLKVKLWLRLIRLEGFEPSFFV